MHEPVRPLKILLIALAILAVTLIALTSYLFDQSSRQSERHVYSYSIDLSYNTTIDNVTFFIPVPELNSTPYFIGPVLDGTAYGIPKDWNLTLIRENGTTMLAVRTARMVPEYHGYPIRIEPGVSVLPPTQRPGHEYSADTPVLQPISIGIQETSTKEIETHFPLDREPVFFPDGGFILKSGTPPPYGGTEYEHRVPVYISFTSNRPVSISLRVSAQGSNMIWKGGWQSNTYSDTVIVETVNNTTGWVQGMGTLSTAGEGRN